MAAGDLLRLPGIQECPLWADRSARGGDGLRARVSARAKEAAEDLGGTVLHMYVDGLWVKKDGARTPEDFRPMLDEIAARTGLPVALDGIYRWVAFLPSRMDSRLPVANRYFGVFQDGSTKVRGIEVRRRTPPPGSPRRRRSCWTAWRRPLGWKTCPPACRKRGASCAASWPICAPGGCRWPGWWCATA